MAVPAADIVTKQIEPYVLPSLASRIVDLQPDPRGGGAYFALVDVLPAAQLGNNAFILQFDAAHNLVSAWPLGVFRSVPNGNLFRMTATAMAVTMQGVFVVGSVSEKPLGPLTALYVAKFTLGGSYEWVRRYWPTIYDGCRIPEYVHCFGRSIVPLPAPDDDQLMVLFQTGVAFDGVGEPSPSDPAGAATIIIDSNGVVTSRMTRLFGRGQLLPTRLRVLPRSGITLLGRTRWPYPRVERWQGYWARIDKEGNPLFETCYDLGDDWVINDVAEDETESTVIVGGIGHEPLVTAIAMRINDAGNPSWVANYTAPPEIESFASDIKVMLNRGDDFIAAGYTRLFNDYRPWLLRLHPAIPQPVWTKRYTITDVTSPLIASFYGLHFMSDDVVVAGGDNFRRRPLGDEVIVDRSPFLAVSETPPAIDPPQCSVPIPVVTQTPRVQQMFGGMGLDRMPMNDEDLTGATAQYVMRVDTVCERTP